MKRISIITIIIAALVTISSIARIPFGQRFEVAVQAASNPKISDDLKNASGTINVIIQTSSGSTTNLQSAVGDAGGTVRRTYSKIYALAARLPADMVSALATRSDVSYISIDRPVKITGHLETTTGASLVRNYGTSVIGTINGTGIGIAILDTGIAYNHHTFLGADGNTRIKSSIDFTGENRTDDPYGHGTHVAAMAAGNNHVASGAYTAPASNANLINVRVLDSQGQGSTSNAIAGIDWCIANKAALNIRVMNLSFGATAVDSYTNDPLCQAVRKAVNAGIVVCAAAGNMGKDSNGNKIYGAIHSPGIEPSAITVGAANTFGTDSRSDDGVTTYSSRGPTRGYYTDALGIKHYDNLIKPDIIAPGNRLIEAESPGNYLVTTDPTLDASASAISTHKMMYLSGTSMATPAVAGAAALIIQRNPSLTPNLVKALLEYTAQPLANFTTLEQGAGLLNVEGAVRLAGLVRTDLTGRAPGDALLTGAAPAQTSTIAGASFQWGGGIIQKWNFIYGSNLILKYQGIYASGTLLIDGTLLSSGTLLIDGTLLSSGVLLSSGALLVDGTLLSSGTLFVDGTLLANGTALTDGTVLTKTLPSGALLTDGTVQSDGAINPNMAPTALYILTSGDATAYMSKVVDKSRS